MEYKYKVSPINQGYNFPKMSIASSDLSNESLQGSTYNLFEQNAEGRRRDEILYPDEPPRIDLESFKRKEREFIEFSKESIKKKKEQFEQKKKQYDNLIHHEKKNHTQAF